jgi:hypothetical protein
VEVFEADALRGIDDPPPPPPPPHDATDNASDVTQPPTLASIRISIGSGDRLR